MKKIIRLLCSITCLFFYSQDAIGQWRLNQIAGEEGLSQNTIRSIIQDQHGFIWIGTYNGINKYDGYGMEHFKYTGASDGLSSNIIVKLFEDTEGYIWAGTTNAGLNRIDPNTGEIKVYFNDVEHPNYFNEIDNIFQLEKGTFFINKNKGINVFKVTDDGALLFQKNVSQVDGFGLDVKRISPAENGNYWLFTPDKSIKFHQMEVGLSANIPVVKIHETGVTENLFTKGYAVNFIEHKANVLWVVSDKLQLLKLELNNQLELVKRTTIDLVASKNSASYRKLNITIDKNDRLWIAGNGLLLNFDTNTHKITNFKHNNQLKHIIKGQQIQEVLVDRSNILWLGTLNNGLYNLDLETHTFFNSGEFLKGNFTKKFHSYPILSMCEDSEGDIWLGTQGKGGIALLKRDELKESILDISKEPWDYKYVFQNNFKVGKTSIREVKRLTSDSKGGVWVGTKQGLSHIKYNKKTGVFLQNNLEGLADIHDGFTHPVFAIEEDVEGNIWTGYWNGGLVKLTLNEKNELIKTSHFKPEVNDPTSLSNNYVRDILEVENGDIWVGTIGGLNKLSAPKNGNKAFVRYLNEPGKENSLSNNYVLDVFESRTGKLYVGTFGGGLNSIDVLKNDALKFTNYTMADGLPSDVVYQMKEDLQGNIWMMHVREISRLNPSTGEITYFEKQDGFTVNEFKDNAMLFTSSDIMICGGVDGLTFFNPNKLSSNSYIPEVAITEFKLFNETIKPFQKIESVEILTKSISKTKEITLSHHLNSIEFVFSSMHFSNPEKNKYKYKLEGFDTKWQYSIGNDRRFASYTNLAPGNYTFNVFGSNSSGNWSAEPKQIKVFIKKPWYFRPWALSLFLITSIVIAFLLVRIRLNQIRLQGQIELDSALHEKSEEINKMKLQFFTNISHELRTPLTLVIGPLQQIMKGNTDPEYLKKLNVIMYKNSLRLLKLINQLLDFRKVESGNLDLQIQQGDLGVFVGNIFEAFEESATEKELKFVYLNAQDSFDAWFDSDKIEKIIYNLLSNSFKFTPKGKSIKIVLEKEIVAGKSFALIKVIDYGIGIPQDELDSIFERFYQAKKENNSIHIGSGLGLAYTKRLVEIHKGTIAITSELHEGTTCSIKIPIDSSSYDATQIVDLLPKKHDLRFTKKEIKDHKKIQSLPQNDVQVKEYTDDTPVMLIVEDNAELRNYVANFFRSDYKVLTADNGEKGLEIAQKELPNIIISDLMMPKMDGIEMCKRIKTDIKTSHIPVLILTAKSGLENEKEGLETGADEFVLKPFNIEVLKLRVDNILRTKRRWIQKFKTLPNATAWKELSNKLDQEFLKKTIEIIRKNMDNTDFSVQQLSEDAGISRSVMFKKIKSITGQSSSEFIRTIRIKKAEELMRTSNYLITEIIFMVGFSDPKYFRTCFKKQYDMTPSEYLKSIKK